MESYYLKKKKKIRYKELFTTTFLTHGGSNIISKLLVSPLERAVIIRQIQPLFFRNILMQSSFTYSNIIRSIRANQGYSSFWWGYNAGILNFLSFSFFRLLFHDHIKHNLPVKGTNRNKENFLITFFLLYTSSCMAAAISYPLDTIHNCMALNHETVKQKKTYSRSVLLFMYNQLIKKKFRNLYSGYSLCLLNFIPYLAITIKLNELFTEYFLEFNVYKKGYDGKNEEDNSNNINEEYKKLFAQSPNFFSYILLGVLTGYIAQFATYPLETIRRKYQYRIMYEQYFPTSLINYKRLNNQKRKTFVRKISNMYRGFSLHSFKLIPEYLIFSCFFYYVKNNIPI
ncbi:ADP/ATP carrier protein, putative [Plasmodium ovale]|uniref:ADP/ATP carrier protein, putative n=2 Tax=Plasmodium ovale TaxID=36330 RepID=A0A1C3KR76_PLAOA|nr:ADP/ATP carrier protein, putative [Plasmodium ovale]